MSRETCQPLDFVRRGITHKGLLTVCRLEKGFRKWGILPKPERFILVTCFTTRSFQKPETQARYWPEIVFGPTASLQENAAFCSCMQQAIQTDDCLHLRLSLHYVNDCLFVFCERHKKRKNRSGNESSDLQSSSDGGSCARGWVWISLRHHEYHVLSAPCEAKRHPGGGQGERNAVCLNAVLFRIPHWNSSLMLS